MLERQLNQEKNKFLSSLFKRGKLSELEQHLTQKKVTIEEVRRDIEERYKLLDEISGLSALEQDRTEIRKRLDEFYKSQEELHQKFNKEQEVKSVSGISKKEGVFFIHAMPLIEGIYSGSEYNNAFVEGNKLAVITRLKLIMGLSPTLSCSTIKEGDIGQQTSRGEVTGVIISRGRVLFASESDAYTIAEDSPFIRRSKNATKDFNPLQSDIQQNPEENIKKSITEKSNYNEFVVENPEIAGIIFDYEKWQNSLLFDTDGTTRAKIEEFQKIAEELQLPLYVWKDGKVQIFEGLSPQNKINTNQEVNFYDLEKRTLQLSPEDKRRYLESIISENPFKINKEVKKMYSAYKDGEIAYKILVEKDDKTIKENNFFITNYALMDYKYDENEDRVIENINSLDTYLQTLDYTIDIREKNIKEAEANLSSGKLDYSSVRTTMEKLKDNKEELESTYAQVYGISKIAEKNKNTEIAQKIEEWLAKRGALERMRKFVSERIDENGQLKFIFEEDVPKDVQKILAGKVS